jgi:dUTP pyrophosphatase
MKTVEMKFVKLTETAQLPTYAHGYKEDAGMDLYADEDGEVFMGQPVAIRTGIAIELPPGYEAQVRPRGGLAIKHGITVLNSPGTVDPSYRGEVMVIVAKVAGPEPWRFRRGDRIAQMVIAEYVGAKAKTAKALSRSARGAGGFGSTGV